jgi:hypothetical protein
VSHASANARIRPAEKSTDEAGLLRDEAHQSYDFLANVLAVANNPVRVDQSEDVDHHPQESPQQLTRSGPVHPAHLSARNHELIVRFHPRVSKSCASLLTSSAQASMLVVFSLWLKPAGWLARKTGDGACEFGFVFMTNALTARRPRPSFRAFIASASMPTPNFCTPA